MFKNYNIIIFKDKEGGYLNLRLRGWLTVLVIFLLIGLTAVNLFLWDYYSKSQALESALDQAKQEIEGRDSQMLALTNRLLVLEKDMQRVEQFDAKLRVLMNIGDTPGKEDANDTVFSQNIAILSNPGILSRHRELFTRHAFSLVEELTDRANLEEVGQQRLMLFMQTNKDALLSTPSIWPADGFLTSGFGWRTSPFTGKAQAHKGIDIANRPGTPIWAPARGVVTFAGYDGAYGLCIMIDHGNNLTTRYAHLQKATVKANQFVQRGEVIGSMGSSGRTTGPHLHYEVHIGGVPVNPMQYILN